MKRESGYTIMEVGLALAISGSMLFMVASLHDMSNRQRFNDAVNGTRTFLERQYNDVQFGINNRLGGKDLPAGLEKCSRSDTDKTTGNSDCYVIGRLIEFEKNKMVVSYIVATPDKHTPEGRMWDNPDGIKDSAAKIIYTASHLGWLKVLPAGAADKDSGSRASERGYGGDNVFEKAWSVTRKNKMPIDEKNTAVAILHNPIGGAVMTYSNVIVNKSAGDKVAWTLRFKGDDNIEDSISELNNTLGVVVYIKRENSHESLFSKRNSYSVVYCIPAQNTSAGLNSKAPAPFNFEFKDDPNDTNNLIGVCDETTKSKR